MATTICAVLAQYVTDHADELEFDEVTAGSFDYRVGDLESEPLATLRAPHPERPWQDRGLEEAPLRESGRRLVAEFVAAARAAGRAESWLDVAEPAALELVEYTTLVLGRSVERCTPKELEEYLTEILPEKLFAYDPIVAATPESLDAFTAWLGDAGHLTARKAANLRQRLTEATPAYERFVRRLPRARPVGRPGTSVPAATDRAAASPEPNVAGAPEPVRIAPAPLQAGRWVWDGQGAKPDPKAPCPCGSGRRYKKCCMPR